MEKFFYRVNQGETVQSVAKKFNLSPISIIKDNYLKDEIQAGDVGFEYYESEDTYIEISW